MYLKLKDTIINMDNYDYCKVVYKPEERKGIGFYKQNGTPFTIKYDVIERAERDFLEISGFVLTTGKPI